MGPQRQVRWIDALRVVARMKNEQVTWGSRTVEYLVRYAVSLYIFAQRISRESVSLLILRSGPNPAGFGFSNPREKAFAPVCCFWWRFPVFPPPPPQSNDSYAIHLCDLVRLVISIPPPKFVLGFWRPLPPVIWESQPLILSTNS